MSWICDRLLGDLLEEMCSDRHLAPGRRPEGVRGESVPDVLFGDVLFGVLGDL